MTVIGEFCRPCGCWEHVSAFHRCAEHVAHGEATDGIAIGCYEPNKIDAATRDREIREAVLAEREACAVLAANLADVVAPALIASAIRGRR